MKRTQLNMGLAAAVLGLAVAVWVSDTKEEKGEPLTAIAAAELQSIVITHPDKPEIRLEKRDSTWRLVAPVEADTDPFEVSSLVGLASLEVKRSLPVADVDLAELKLDPPHYTITLDGRTLAFGDTEPIGHRRYIRVDGQVQLVVDPPSAALDADYSDLVARELLPKNARIQRIEVPGLTVRRSDDGIGWIAEQQPQASADQLAQFVEAWRNARAMWNGLQPEGSGDAGTPVRIVLDGGEIVLRAAQREPQLLIDNPALKVRYTVSRAEADKLFALPAPPSEPEATPPAP